MLYQKFFYNRTHFKLIFLRMTLTWNSAEIVVQHMFHCLMMLATLWIQQEAFKVWLYVMKNSIDEFKQKTFLTANHKLVKITYFFRHFIIKYLPKYVKKFNFIQMALAENFIMYILYVRCQIRNTFDLWIKHEIKILLSYKFN